MALNPLISYENSLSIKTFKSEYNFGSFKDDCGDNFSHYTELCNNHKNRVIGGLKFFAFVILQAWRKSKREIKELKHSIEGIRKSNERVETQIHVFSTLIKVEQNRTDELTLQLKRTLENLRRKTASCKTFSKTLVNLKNSQNLLEVELKKRQDEYDALNEILAQTKKQLFRSMMEQRNLHLHLCQEQRTVQTLESEKTLLLTEIRGLNAQHRKLEENFFKQLREKDFEIIETKHLLGQCQATYFDFPHPYNLHDKTENGGLKMDHQLQLKRLEHKDLERSCKCSLCKCFETCWLLLLEYPKYTLNYIHLFSYYLLPAMPLPPAKQNYGKST